MNKKIIKIPNTDLNIYPIGQGTLFGRSLDGYSRSKLINKKIDVLKYGIDIGMNFIDTGEDYEGGTSEELLSEVVKGKRDKIIIGSKFKPSNNGYNNVIKSLESSLKELKLTILISIKYNGLIQIYLLKRHYQQ